MYNFEMQDIVIFSIFYILLTGCIIYPPNEFIAAGLTIENIFSGWLGSENAHFIQYHIRRSIVTIFIHSILPLGYALGLLTYTENGFYTIFIIPFSFQLFIYFALALPIVILAINTDIWSKNNWKLHPICKNLSHFANNNSDWISVASSINIEFRRVDKICIQINSINKVIATDNWILKVTPYTIYCAHQSDASLVVDKSDTHELSHHNHSAVQFINIKVKSLREGVETFTIRLNALDFKDLQDRSARPIIVLPNVTFHKTLLERFIDTFKEQIQDNPKFLTSEDLETCIGCMQTTSNVKLQKNCEEISTEDENSRCMTCHCKPLWCADCMAKWFASRQNEAESETWLSSKCTCPLCRSKFCILDVSYVESRDS